MMSADRDLGIVWGHEIDAIFNHDVWLGDIGVRNWAFFIEEAIIVLEQLKVKNITVLGGDVYIVSEGKLKSNRDNWYFNLHGVDPERHISASVEKAKSYILNYDGDDLRPMFAIVPKVE